MTHLPDETLVLFAYGELDEPVAAQATAHLGECGDCRMRLVVLERARVTLEVAAPRATRRRWWWAAAGALAAAVVFVVGGHRAPPRPAPMTLHVPRYTAPALAPIDSLLTRLEQEKPYGTE